MKYKKIKNYIFLNYSKSSGMTDLESNDTNRNIPHNLEKEFIADKCSTPTEWEHVYCVEGID